MEPVGHYEDCALSHEVSSPCLPLSIISEYHRMVDASATESGPKSPLSGPPEEKNAVTLDQDELKDLVVEAHNEIGVFIARLAAQLPYLRHTTDAPSPTDSGYQCLDSDFLAPLLPLQEIPLSLSPDFFSPVPETSYSPVDQRASANREKLENTIEELIESELTHVAALKMLLGYYIEPFIATSKGVCGVPLVLMEQCLHALIDTHTELIQTVCTHDWVTGGVEHLVEAIAARGLNVPLYGDFCALYDDILALMKQHTLVRLIGTNAMWLRSWQAFLEALQPNARKMDLSFTSLLQKPIARVGKYRLLVEAMIKVLPLEKKAGAYEALGHLKKSLDYINTSSCTVHDLETPHSINRVVSWGSSALGAALSLQFFGKPLLVGPILAIWPERDGIRTLNGAGLLYKSHFVVCQLTKNRLFSVLFIIALSAAKVVSSNKETEGGLFLAFPYTIKVLFEEEECHYETLLVQLTKKEHTLWLDYLYTLVEHVNGPYPMDYTVLEKRLCQYPENTRPYDICTQKMVKTQKHDSAYFKATLCVRVELDFPASESERFAVLESFFGDMGAKKEGETTVVFRKTERALLEAILSGTQSRELPVYFLGEKRSRLTKMSSWRFASLRGFKEEVDSPETEENASIPTTGVSRGDSGNSWAKSRVSGRTSGSESSLDEPSSPLNTGFVRGTSGSIRGFFKGVSLTRRPRVRGKLRGRKGKCDEGSECDGRTARTGNGKK